MTKFCYFLTGLMQTRMNVRCLFVIISVSACVSGCTGQRSLLSAQPAPQRIAQVEGATLDRISLQQDNVVYIQTIDLQKMAIEQLTGNIDRRKGVKGLYYPDKRPEASPFFVRLPVAAVLQNYQKLHGTKLFSVVNASFFEDYDRSTRLSFPIKINGKIITAGSSPYGPIAKPAEPYYRTIQLKALTWKDSQVSVINYNPQTGYPLNQSNVDNGFVSYAYQDHPAYVLAEDPVNRYHVFGVTHGDQDKWANQLLIATTNRATLKEAGNILRQRGVKSDLMTIDGGISTYLWTAKLGDLVLPQVAQGEKEAALPHYLGIWSKEGL
jgi:hypothetical protein